MLQRATPTIRELLSYRLHQVANLLSRGAEMRYRREFGVSLWEWRTVALLGGAGEAAVAERARARRGHGQGADEPRGLGPDPQEDRAARCQRRRRARHTAFPDAVAARRSTRS